VSVYLVIHLFTMSVSLARETPYGELFHGLTDPWQWTVGMHQNWDMFVPDPRLETSWLEVEGVRPDGSRVPIAMPHGVPDPQGVILLYDRSGKLERNAISKKRDGLRASFTRWACREHAAAGDPLAEIVFTKASQATVPPAERASRPRAGWPVRRTPLEGWRCAR
jgi:hypothetical protein